MAKLPSASPPLTVPQLDIEKYIGRWYQLADYPQFYELATCKTCVTANYSLNDDGSMRVVNDAASKIPGITCRIKGRAAIIDPSQPGKLSLRFNFFPSFFSDGEYWIVEIGPENDQGQYSWAIVSQSSRKSLYILSRSPSVPHEEFLHLLSRAEEQGFDTSKLKITKQSNCAYPTL